MHPAGHVFAVGHTDGSIAFWALEDEDKPLFTLTLDGQHDVHLVDADKLDTVLAEPKNPSAGSREPIFKLAWSGFPNSSDPRGGDTVLTVLGGLRSDEAPGITSLLLPPFTPPEPPAPVAGSTLLDQATRTAMRQTVIPANSYVYPTEGVPQDFLLLPRESPHFSGSWDPAAILLLSDGHKDSRVTEVYEFPPPSFAPQPENQNDAPPQTPIEGTSDSLDREVASTLEWMKLNDDPKPLRVPPSLWSGTSGVISGHLMSLTRDTYELLTLKDAVREDDAIRLRGGSAWVEDNAAELKLMKVITSSGDNILSLSFFLVSATSCPNHPPCRLDGPLPRSQRTDSCQLRHIAYAGIISQPSSSTDDRSCLCTCRSRGVRPYILGICERSSYCCFEDSPANA